MTDPRRRNDEENPEVRRETSDVSVRGILYSAAALLVVAVVIHVGAWWLFEYLREREEQAKPNLFPLAAEARQQREPPRPDLPTPPDWSNTAGLPPPPARPRLEGVLRMEGTTPYVRPGTDRIEQPAAPDSYAWVDKDQGVVQIPLERAMELLVEKESSRGQTADAPGTPPSRANSGRAPNGREP